MKQLRVEEVRSIALGWRLSLGIDTMVTGVSIDSRTAEPGDVFVAIRGERFDGHDFLPQAADAGCVAAIVLRDTKIDPDLAERFPGGVIGVADPVKALADLAAHQRKSIGGTVVAVTGSNGKTTVKRMVDHILSSRMRGLASPKSFNNAIGVPLTLLDTDGAEDYVICEIGTNAPGEVASLSRVVEPDVAVVTCVAEAHLEKLGTLERVASEKASLLSALKPRGLAIINADQDVLVRSLRAYERRTVGFGESTQAELRLTAYRPADHGARFTLNDRLDVRLSVPGRHNALNALAAIGVAQRFGFGQEEAARLLEGFEGVEMRLERIEVGTVTIINDAYNANPASMRAAGEVLVGAGRGRKVFIAGDMLELGAQAEELHRAVGRSLAEMGVDVVIGVGKLGRLVAEAAGEAGPADAHPIASTRGAGRQVVERIREGDVVMVKGSRAMQMDKLIAPISKAFGDSGGAGAKGSQR